MARLQEVCRDLRSKNAGPFWVTIDIFFDGAESFRRYAHHPALGAEAIGKLFGVDPALVKRFPVESLEMIKISYPRRTPQGGVEERDLHAGQQFVRLLDLDLD
ncbi:DUF4387 domain-containing protein [Phenylobacterium terrae]|uniref:DUF4387 domain-containing protein n=1 Tax=Phenylobacterium terrae TaxID=2665495 RepID=A0ABW4N762_9CAUL